MLEEIRNAAHYRTEMSERTAYGPDQIEEKEKAMPHALASPASGWQTPKGNARIAQYAGFESTPGTDEKQLSFLLAGQEGLGQGQGTRRRPVPRSRGDPAAVRADGNCLNGLVVP